MAKSSVLFEHAQRYAQEVMAPRLREEGFVSYKGEDLHWYRLVNNEIVQAVYLGTRHTAVQSPFSIYVGFHPLFIPPIFQRSPYFRVEPSYVQMCHRIPELIPGSTPHGMTNLMLYGQQIAPYRVPDVLIPCPVDKNYGLDVLEQVFPFLETVKTPEACYKMHKRMNKSNLNTAFFLDEVLFWNDKEMHSVCQEYMDWMLPMLRAAEKTGKFFFKVHKEELERLLLIKEAFTNRDQYMEVLKARTQETLRLLKKYTGISTCEESAD